MFHKVSLFSVEIVLIIILFIAKEYNNRVQEFIFTMLLCRSMAHPKGSRSSLWCLFLMIGKLTSLVLLTLHPDNRMTL